MMGDINRNQQSERLLWSSSNYNPRFRWLVGLSIDDPVRDATVFCKNRDGSLTARLQPSS
jgi:transposase